MGQNRHKNDLSRSLILLMQSRMPPSQVRGSKRLGCHANLYTVSRCRTRGESQEFIAHRWQSMQARDPPWLWNPGETSPEVENRVSVAPRKRTYVLQKLFFKKKQKVDATQPVLNVNYNKLIQYIYWLRCTFQTMTYVTNKNNHYRNIFIQRTWKQRLISFCSWMYNWKIEIATNNVVS